jgi:hypothetical protein
MRKSKDKTKILYILSFLIIITMILTYVNRSNNKVNFGDSVKINNTQKEEINVYKLNYKFYLDGWSYLSLPKSPIKYYVTQLNGELREGELKFNQLPATEYNILLSHNPKIIENLLSYLITNKKVHCSALSCKIDNKDFNLLNLADLTNNNDFSTIYKGYKINSAVYYADIPYNEGEVITLISPKEKLIEINSIRTPDLNNNILEGKNMPIIYNYAFGNFFINNPLWIDGIQRWETPSLEDITKFNNRKSTLSLPLYRGLGDLSRNDLDSLSDSILTYLSSPVTGCGVLAICIPGEIDSKFTILESESAKLCGKNNDALFIDYIRSKITLTLKNPTHLYGIWNGNSSDSNNTNILGYKGFPNLSGGQIDMINNLLILKNSKNDIIDFIGSRVQIGIEDTSNNLDSINLTNKNIKKFFNNYFKVC